ncbi:MAG: acyl-CoA dehydrogenase family protein [Dehalococcoidia bacterium]
MDLSLTETQVMLKQSVEDFISRDANKDIILDLQRTLPGYSSKIWQTAAETGWLGIIIPEAYGGIGMEFFDAAVVYEALGSGAVPGPMFSSGVLSALVLLECATEEQKQAWLPSIAEGRVVYTVATSEPDYSWGNAGIRMRPTEDGNDYVLNGVKLFVYDADVADQVIVAVRTGDLPDDISLVMVDTATPGVSRRRLSGFTSTECELKFENVRVAKSNLIGRFGAIAPGLASAFTKATPILCAYQVGGMQTVFEMSVEHSRRRVQFGQAIGRFQFVQNHIIQLVNHLDAARWTTYEALWKLDSGRDAEVSVHLAKAVTSEGYRKACDYAHEVHAGVGVMREFGLTLYTRLSRSLYHALGDPRYHRRRIADLIETIDLDAE